MRASWSRIVTAISAAAVLAASVGLPGTLVGRKGEHSVGVAAPPVVVHTVVPAAPVPVGAAPSPGLRARPAAGGELVAVRIPGATPRSAAAPHPDASEQLTRPAPKPTSPISPPAPPPA